MPSEHVVVAEDGKQGAEGGRREPDRDRDERPDEADRGQHTGHRQRANHRDQPRRDREPTRSLAEQLQLELVAGEQEQETQPDVRDEHDAVRLAPAEHIWPDQDATEDQQDDLGHPQGMQQPGDERRESRHQADHQEGVEPTLEAHAVVVR